ncbi:MAG: M23 family metallopeptidase [Clostridia bacterium]
MNNILNKRLKFYTKEVLKISNITLIAFGFIIAIILIKYKPVYAVKISGEEVGYVKNIKKFEENIENDVKNYQAKNIEQVEIVNTPEYKLKLIDKAKETNESQIIVALQKEIKITYQYYNLELDGEIIESVNTLEEAEKIKKDLNLEDLIISKKTTENIEEVKTNDIELAKNTILEKKNIQNDNSIADINGIKIATLPVTGTISSRYGVRSKIRVSTHTGLDIAVSTGTRIKVIADGTVVSAQYTGAYGNLVKIDHGNGFESWYAHTSKMYVTVGQKVSAGDVIAAVGSTGNSTGPHLHLEIRLNGQSVDPQKYLYN